MTAIISLTAQEAEQYLPALISLLQDAVDSGASIGFLPPLSETNARTYWLKVIADLKGNTRILLAAFDNTDRLLGAVQLALETKFNGRHRAEVQKLFVHREARGRGLGRALMIAIEQMAVKAAVSLLVLDTRQGDTAEQLYQKIGYVRAGVIPNYACNADGGLDATVIFYKELAPVSS